ncbi:hypothetical protein Agabi119p4_3090 [Agaricus bisporus var. burnettii]|uniref:Uncharacterized protein n=1 Tax=Agaricus bisporus var. burnettii TaxID=192524 RepID=A0A8H7KIK2_AGABI|nr:hypothetical protein AGABI2DRAFT_190504 [Agaricus bisporus var. bisporus H97]EKV50103.1 hypothetical protein AGABI2DRAFT_190504 [Agaricus bisporus var. bisporus H97]KAF7778745.1 hypothetical protein Agabi119p4_3090 [Agaricus bisporus var. burnettii]
MCHNVIDGRYYTTCQHFEAMSTRTSDCLEANCIFSRRHSHSTTNCRGSCKRLMALPIRNPIRLSSTACSNCIAKTREGVVQCRSPA